MSVCVSGETVAAVVVTYDRLDQLRLTVTRLLQESVDHVVVVDNGSTDGTREWLRDRESDRLTALFLPENIGGAGGFEYGMRWVDDNLAADWILLLDDDARPHRGALDRFRGMDRTGIDAIAAAVYYPDGQVCEMNRPSLNPFWHIGPFLRTLFGKGRMGFHIADDTYRQTEPVNIDAASFVGLFVSRATVRDVGFPDGRLFIYGDDVLYTLAMGRAGRQVAFAPRIVFEHDCRTKNRANERKVEALWKVYYLYRNSIGVYRSAAGPLFWPLLPVVLLKWYRNRRFYPGRQDLHARLLRTAVRDGLSKDYSRPLDEVKRLSAPETAA